MHFRQNSSSHRDDMQEPLITSSPASNVQNSPRQTPKRNRFKTMFFKPAMRDSGISLSQAVDDPRQLSVQVPTFTPSLSDDSSGFEDDGIPQEELDYLVDELSSQFGGTSRDADSSVCLTLDRADSPTLGSSESWPSFPVPSTGPKSGVVSSGRTSPLPGASFPNSPLQDDAGISNVAEPSRKRKPRPRSLGQLKPRSRIQPQLVLPAVFQSLALTDANVAGQPIRYMSPAYRAGDNALKVGACTFLNLAYGADVECGLRVEASKTVFLQIAQRVVNTSSGRSVWLLCCETDITAAFTPDVRSELAEQVASPKPLQPKVYSPDSDDGDDDVWMTLANTISGPSLPFPMRMPSSFASSPPAPSPALADLLSLLTELRFMHRHFFILRGNTTTSKPNMTWISSSLHYSLVNSSMLAAFKKAALTQTKKWVSTTAKTFRQRMILPRVAGFADREEEMGVVGVWMSEDGSDAGGSDGTGVKTEVGQDGCWVCFVVAAGVEEVV